MKPLGIKKILPILPVLIVLSSLSGCISSVSNKMYYQLHLDNDRAGSIDGSGIQTVNKILMVETVEVDEVYDDFRVVYRMSPYQLNYYSYHFWVKKPAKLVEESITGYLSKSKVFAKVTTRFAEGDPDLLLIANVHILEEFDQPGVWFAHLKMDLEIKDFKTGERILFHSFDRHRRLLQKKVGRLPIGISKILQEELDKVIKDLARATS